MDKIVDIQMRRREMPESAVPRGPAAIVFFPGVRYERDCEPRRAAGSPARTDKKSGEAAG